MIRLNDDPRILVDIDDPGLFNTIYDQEKYTVEVSSKDSKLFKKFNVDIERCLKICMNQIAHELRELILASGESEVERELFYQALTYVDFGESLEMGIASYIIERADEHKAEKELAYAKKVMEKRENRRVDRWGGGE